MLAFTLPLDCNEKFVGETSRNLQKRIYEHKRNLIKGNVNNSMVIQNLETNHKFDFKYIAKMPESSIISNYNPDLSTYLLI